MHESFDEKKLEEILGDKLRGIFEEIRKTSSLHAKIANIEIEDDFALHAHIDKFEDDCVSFYVDSVLQNYTVNPGNAIDASHLLVDVLSGLGYLLYSVKHDLSLIYNVESVIPVVLNKYLTTNNNQSGVDFSFALRVFFTEEL
jgi:hypothetical protein